MVSVAGSVQAASQSLPWSDGGTDFEVQDPQNSGSVCGQSGISIRDNEDYGFDVANLLSINGVGFGASATAVDVTTVGSDSVATYSGTVGDLLITVSYRFAAGDLARTLVTITNQGTTTFSGPVTLGFDTGDTFTVRSVSGGTWRNSGNWFVMSENGVASNVFDNYKAVFHLPDGPGSPESPASVTLCSGAVTVGTSSEQIVYGYTVNVPAGESRRILVFQGMDPTADGVTTEATSFGQASKSPGSGILSDLSLEDACTVVNWVLEGCGSDEGSGGGSYDFDDIDIDHYRQPTELPDTE
jgi:hypothetical protein